jgi:3-hydroxyisobutyrate dehydrogenase
MNDQIDRRIAVIGLGAMGGAMAAALHRSGWEVTGFDPSEAARTASQQAGIKTTANLDEVAGTPYAVLSLPAASIVETTVPQLLTVPGTVAIIDTTPRSQLPANTWPNSPRPKEPPSWMHQSRVAATVQQAVP